MKEINSLQEATAHFELSIATVLCRKEGEQPQYCSNLTEARAYYGFDEAEGDENGSQSPQGSEITGDGTGSALPEINDQQDPPETKVSNNETISAEDETSPAEDERNLPTPETTSE
jgi:hypothetical protein